MKFNTQPIKFKKNGITMNLSNGPWTDQKIEIVVEYTRAYLKRRKSIRSWKLLYFDGFAGSGKTGKQPKRGEKDIIEEVAKRILSLNKPRSFDLYYFIDKKKSFVDHLKKTIDTDFHSKKLVSFVETGDCNNKLKDIAAFLKSKGPEYKVLAFIDPCGMQLKWESIECLKGLNIDMWILVPLGMGVNRLLKKDGNISDSWMKKLQEFLGLSAVDIKKAFYEDQPVLPLFGKETEPVKKEKTIEIAGNLYRKRLRKVFKHVSKPFLLVNKKHNIMYHFILGSNSRTAVRIANDLIKN